MKNFFEYLGEEWFKCIVISVPFYLTVKAVKFVLTDD